MEDGLVETVKGLAAIPQAMYAYGWLVAVGAAVFATGWSLVIDLTAVCASHPWQRNGRGKRRGNGG